MPHFKIEETNIYYEDQGKGEPLLLIAGLNCDSRVWTLVLDELKKSYRVIFFDNRGVGQSDSIHSPITIETMAHDAFNLLNFLNISKATVIGHSMGGTIAQTMAYLHPQRINKLIICNSLVKVSRVNRLLGALLFTLRSCGINPQRLLKRAVPFLFAKEFRKNKEQMQEITQGFLGKSQHPQSFLNYRRQLEALLSFNSRSWLHQIQSPTLIISGKEDRLCSSDSKLLARYISQSKLISLSQVGHVPMLEKPHIFVQTVKDFMD